MKRVQAFFYRSQSGKEPVRDWLRALDKADRIRIGADIKTVEYGWPIGMPTCKAMGEGLFEVRTTLPGRIARVLFCCEEGKLILLHGFIKKTRKTPAEDLQLARQRHRNLVKERT